MTWVKLDDQFADHPKVVAAGPMAAWLYVCGLTYAARLMTDGYIPNAQVRRLADIEGADEQAQRLVDVGLWEVVEDGFQIHDYEDYQLTRADIEKKRAAGQAGGKASAKARATAPGEAPAGKVLNRPDLRPDTDKDPQKEPEASSAHAREEPAAAAEETAEILVQCSWVGDEVADVTRQILRSWTLVPDFSIRDGPLEAEKYGRYHARAKKQPRDWYRAWLNWIKAAVQYSKNGANRSPPGGHLTETEADARIDAIVESWQDEQ